MTSWGQPVHHKKICFRCDARESISLQTDNVFFVKKKKKKKKKSKCILTNQKKKRKIKEEKKMLRPPNRPHFLPGNNLFV